MRPMIGFAILAFIFAEPAAASNSADMTAKLQAALQANDRALALNLAGDLYEVSDAANDDKSAGYFSFVRAGLFEVESDFANAAKSYRECAKHYDGIDAHAQSIQCQYKSARALLADNKQGQAIDELKGAAKRLEQLGQEKSALAAEIYLTLADEKLPPKIDGSHQAAGDRRAVVNYAEKTLVALSASGLSTSPRYVSALFTKALALEDAEEFEDAAKNYMRAIIIYKTQPDPVPEVLRNLQTRLSISKFGARGKTIEDTIDVRLQTGELVSLNIIRKKAIKVPRINKNQRVDGARVRAKIHLFGNGKVSRIEILESMPSEKFGEAFKDAVKTWEFQPPKTAGAPKMLIPPFEYSMIFYTQRM